MATPITFDPATWNSATAAPFTVGGVYSYLGRLFRYALNAADAAIADGVVCTRASATAFTITGCSRATALTGATTIGGIAAGVGVGAISVSQYGFLLVFGDHTNVLGVATVSVGREQILSATADSGVDKSAQVYYPTFGTALTTLTGARYSVAVGCL